MSIVTLIILIIAIRAIGNIGRSRRIRNTQKVRVCRHCHEFIPYGASVCPYCHKNPGRDWAADRDMAPSALGEVIGSIFWGFILLMAAVIMLGFLI